VTVSALRCCAGHVPCRSCLFLTIPRLQPGSKRYSSSTEAHRSIGHQSRRSFAVVPPQFVDRSIERCARNEVTVAVTSLSMMSWREHVAPRDPLTGIAQPVPASLPLSLAGGRTPDRWPLMLQSAAPRAHGDKGVYGRTTPDAPRAIAGRNVRMLTRLAQVPSGTDGGGFPRTRMSLVSGNMARQLQRPCLQWENALSHLRPLQLPVRGGRRPRSPKCREASPLAAVPLAPTCTDTT